MGRCSSLDASVDNDVSTRFTRSDLEAARASDEKVAVDAGSLDRVDGHVRFNAGEAIRANYDIMAAQVLRRRCARGENA